MRITITALAMVVALSSIPAADPVEVVEMHKGAERDTGATFVIEGDPTEHERTLARWAHRRFADQGLRLPTVVIEFPADAARCGGNMGVTIHGEAQTRIVACTDTAIEVVVQRTLLHELAHVWAEAALDEATIAAFLDLRDLEGWADGSWGDRGSEHAAEIITWALMDRELTMLTLEDHDPAGLAEGYRVLTGCEVPSGRTGSVG